MKISSKLQPLFEIPQGKHPQVDLVIVTGGRLGSKSYGVSTFIAEALVQYEWSTLYTRFTNVSGADSTVPEMSEKIDLLNYRDFVRETTNRIEGVTGGKIVFKGLKAGSGTQSANLKSLKDFNCWVNDESEEIPSFEVFDKIHLSIRHPKKRNLTILILNPTDRDFWLWEQYFKPKDVPDFFNGIIDNVMYIHTNYLDVPREVIPDNIYENYQRRRLSDPQYYHEVILGGWITNVEGALFTRSSLNYFKLDDLKTENRNTTIAFVDVADQGLDSLCMAVGMLIGDMIYIIDVVHSKEVSNFTIPLVAAMINDLKVDRCVVESNAMGYIYGTNLQERVTIDLDIIPTKGNKHHRIVGNSGYLKKYFVFRDDYEAGTPYDSYMREIFAYTKDGKSKHDDAPDATTGLALFKRELFDS
jgi:PBSX family phage terminase large subunit